MRNLFLVILSFQLFTVAHAQQHNLDYFLEQAFSNNPDIKNTEAPARRIQFDSLRARSILKPQVNAHSRLWYAPLINISVNQGNFFSPLPLSAK